MHRSIVAIIEDDPSMRRGVERLLAAYGFATESYECAEDFLARVAATKAECVILDIHLAGMSGIMLRRRLSAAGSALPVIFMTAVDEAGTERVALEAGCVAYLRKPFPAEALIGAVRQAILPPP
jgi:FixJ family two-component response regulator